MHNFTVSLCIVAYNEEDYLSFLFENILKQTYPKSLTEIVLVDSMSTDNTKKVLEDFKIKHSDEYKNIIVVQNPKKILAAGCNIALKNSNEDIIIRIDAHAEIPPEFIERNVNYHKQGEMITGGARPNIIDGETAWKRTLLMAESSMFGSSIADFRHNSEKRYVKSIFHGAYRREVYEKVGLYNEFLGRTEDNEMSQRIRDNGYNICLCPDIISYQQTRSDLKKMLKQKYGNGYWIGRTMGICPKCISIYHFVPFVFVTGGLTALLLSFISLIFPILYFGLYFLAAILMTIVAFINEKKKHILNFTLPLLFFLLHTAYGIGTFFGLLSLITKKPKPEEKSFEKLENPRQQD